MRAVVGALLVVLILAILVVGGYFAIVATAGEQGFADIGNLVEGVFEGDQRGAITAEEFRATRRGTSLQAVTARLGEPADPPALERKPDVRDEPPNASCLYYSERVAQGQAGRLFRFCFTKGKLSSKRAL